MSGFSQSSVSSQNSRGTKRKWLPEEDAALVACMVDLHNVGTFNADTGFKAGYLNELEKMLDKVLPHAMLKAKPNLESRIRTLKRNWSIIYDILSGKNNSDFGWDENWQLIVVEDAAWNSYINSHKEACQFKHHCFLYYDQLTAIYTED
ncbi:50S ribosomal L3 [Gossypium arboreum]|uniref:50S ribosomal L3 n=1 Tax=Gossypium arboreum TaxID=29729 RepID=A0A0B0P5U4_GOSAR|nr:50S ribosomal L3 [Gossypium arboreum]